MPSNPLSIFLIEPEIRLPANHREHLQVIFANLFTAAIAPVSKQYGPITDHVSHRQLVRKHNMFCLLPEAGAVKNRHRQNPWHFDRFPLPVGRYLKLAPETAPSVIRLRRLHKSIHMQKTL